MLLDSTQFSSQLFEDLRNSEKSLTAFSAFIKLKALEHGSFKSHLVGKVITVVARWQKRDLVCGASDLEVYRLCKKNGWRFGISLNLHGKLFLIDNSEIFVGSANLTQKGLHIGVVGNHEFGTKITAENADLDKIAKFIDSEVTWMTDNLFEKINSEVVREKSLSTPLSDMRWSQAVLDHCSNPVEYLWVHELLWATPEAIIRPNLEKPTHLHDLELLEINLDDISDCKLANSFRRTRIYSWLSEALEKGPLSFGGLSAKLHNSLLDDPKPYRIDVKTYISNLIAWAGFLNDEFVIERPRYSQIIRKNG